MTPCAGPGGAGPDDGRPGGAAPSGPAGWCRSGRRPVGWCGSVRGAGLATTRRVVRGSAAAPVWRRPRSGSIDGLWLCVGSISAASPVTAGRSNGRSRVRPMSMIAARATWPPSSARYARRATTPYAGSPASSTAWTSTGCGFPRRRSRPPSAGCPPTFRTRWTSPTIGSWPTTLTSRATRPPRTSSPVASRCGIWCARWLAPGVTRPAGAPAIRRRCSCVRCPPRSPASTRSSCAFRPGLTAGSTTPRWRRPRWPAWGRCTGWAGPRPSGPWPMGPSRSRPSMSSSAPATAMWPKPSARCPEWWAWRRPSPDRPRWW